MQTDVTDNSRGFTLYLLFTALVSGALVMMIEVMGSRVIGPFFGVSLFVWTSLITVTLIALAAGYAVGGHFVDRFVEPKYLYLIILLAGALTLLVPVLKAPIIQFSAPLGLRGGAFLSASLLFGPALFMLGCVSPFLVKIAARQLKNIGRVVGGLYALSTVGSTISTVATGFVLVAYLGVDKTFLAIGSMLVVLSVGYFVLFQKQWRALAAVLLPFVLYHPFEFTSKILSDGSELVKVHHEDSYYGSLKVVDSKNTNRHARYLMIDSLIQSVVDMDNGLSAAVYSYYMEFLSYLLNPGGQRCLAVGLGSGIIPSWFEQQGAVCDVVDIDPKVIEITKRFFDYTAKGESVAGDGRFFLAHTEHRYDYVILDAFSGESTPTHLVSIEALDLARQRLTPTGVVSINIIGDLKVDPFMTASIVKTVEQVFDQVEVYPAFNVEDSDGIGNIIIVAYQGVARTFAQIDKSRFVIHPHYDEMVRKQLGKRFYFPPDEPAIVLRDDYNPIDFYDNSLREYIRRVTLESTDWDLLLG